MPDMGSLNLRLISTGIVGTSALDRLVASAKDWNLSLAPAELREDVAEYIRAMQRTADEANRLKSTLTRLIEEALIREEQGSSREEENEENPGRCTCPDCQADDDDEEEED